MLYTCTDSKKYFYYKFLNCFLASICHLTANSVQVQLKTGEANTDVTLFLLLKNCFHFCSWLFPNRIILSTLYHKLYFQKIFSARS